MGPAPDPPAIAGFDHVRLLGSGRFADVHLFQQRFPRRLVAVKVLRDELPTWDAVHAFQLEANALAAVSSHPCIVAIHDAGRATDGRPYLVMEYCPLPTLAQQIRSGTLGVTDALRIGILLAGAVDTAHAHGILHRDIKPANVLMTDYGAPQLADFGIASSAWDRSVVSGLTPAWAAPELIGDPGRASVATDVYALAATVYTMLAGHAPHDHPRVPNDATPVPPVEGPSVPQALTALLARALSVQARTRYRTARQFGTALQDVERELGSVAPTSMVLVDPSPREIPEQTPSMNAVSTMWSKATDDETTTLEQRTSPWWRRAPAIAVAALTVVACGAVVALAWTRDDDDANPPHVEKPSVDASTTSSTGGITDGPLDIDARFANLPCNGRFIVVLGTSADPAENEEKLGARVESVPGAKYLRNKASCSTFDDTLEGEDLYQAYIGPFGSFQRACLRRAELQDQGVNPWVHLAWVRAVDEGTKKRDLCFCLKTAEELPPLHTGQPEDEVAANRPLVSEVQYALYALNYTQDRQISGFYSAETEQVVRLFQELHDLMADGMVRPSTWTELRTRYCED